MELMDILFAVISRLRAVELRKLSCGDHETAQRARRHLEELSAARDRLIVLGMKEARERLIRAQAVIDEAAGGLQEYLSAVEAADHRLEKALEAVSALTAMIDGIRN